MRQPIRTCLQRWTSTARLSPASSKNPPFHIYHLRRCRYASTNQPDTNSGSSSSSRTTVHDEFKAITTPTTIPIEPPDPETHSLQTPSQPATQRFHPLRTIVKSYSRSQARNPLWTQFLSALAIYLFADIGAQSFSEHVSDSDEPDNASSNGQLQWDFPRTARALIIGGVASIPGYKWFMYLGRNFNYRSTVASVATKVIVNQIVFAPLFSTYYFGMSCALSGGSPAEVVQRIRDTVPNTLWNSLFVWPWFQTLNFTFVPAEMRALTSGLFAIGWQAYLSWVNRCAEQRRLLEVMGVERTSGRAS